MDEASFASLMDGFFLNCFAQAFGLAHKMEKALSLRNKASSSSARNWTRTSMN